MPYLLNLLEAYIFIIRMEHFPQTQILHAKKLCTALSAHTLIKKLLARYGQNFINCFIMRNDNHALQYYILKKC